MSTDIKTIGHLNVVRFWNWKENALQLTPLIYDKNYAQLNKKEVKELINVLENAFDLEKFPSD